MRKKTTGLSLKIIIVCALALSALGPTMSAWATFISPKRIIIEDKQRTATVTIHNGSEETTAYRFKWERRAQSPTGESLLLEEGQTTPGYQPADPMLQFSPRQVILKPNMSQKLRILLKRPADLAEGEYHSHLLIEAEPLVEVKPGEEGQQPTLGGVLKVRTNASIPIFVRQGQTNLDIKITDAILTKKNGIEHIKYTISNNSTRSVYAVPYVDCINGGETKTTQITTARIYTEAKTLSLETPIPAGSSVGGCTQLKLRLNGLDDFEFKGGKQITEVPIRQ